MNRLVSGSLHCLKFFFFDHVAIKKNADWLIIVCQQWQLGVHWLTKWFCWLFAWGFKRGETRYACGLNRCTSINWMSDWYYVLLSRSLSAITDCWLETLWMIRCLLNEQLWLIDSLWLNEYLWVFVANRIFVLVTRLY